MSGELSGAEKGENSPLPAPGNVEDGQGKLHRNLKGRHMQMIAMYE
jgi:amino acid permease